MNHQIVTLEKSGTVSFTAKYKENIFQSDTISFIDRLKRYCIRLEKILF